MNKPKPPADTFVEDVAGYVSTSSDRSRHSSTASAKDISEDAGNSNSPKNLSKRSSWYAMKSSISPRRMFQKTGKFFKSRKTSRSDSNSSIGSRKESAKTIESQIEELSDDYLSSSANSLSRRSSKHSVHAKPVKSLESSSHEYKPKLASTNAAQGTYSRDLTIDPIDLTRGMNTMSLNEPGNALAKEVNSDTTQKETLGSAKEIVHSVNTLSGSFRNTNNQLKPIGVDWIQDDLPGNTEDFAQGGVEHAFPLPEQSPFPENQSGTSCPEDESACNSSKPESIHNQFWYPKLGPVHPMWALVQRTLHEVSVHLSGLPSREEQEIRESNSMLKELLSTEFTSCSDAMEAIASVLLDDELLSRFLHVLDFCDQTSAGVSSDQPISLAQGGEAVLPEEDIQTVSREQSVESKTPDGQPFAATDFECTSSMSQTDRNSEDEESVSAESAGEGYLGRNQHKENQRPSFYALLVCLDELQGCFHPTVRRWAAKSLFAALQRLYQDKKLVCDESMVLHIAFEHRMSGQQSHDDERSDGEEVVYNEDDRPIILLAHVIEAASYVWHCSRRFSDDSSSTVHSPRSRGSTGRVKGRDGITWPLVKEAFRNSLLGKLMGLEFRFRDQQQSGPTQRAKAFTLGEPEPSASSDLSEADLVTLYLGQASHSSSSASSSSGSGLGLAIGVPHHRASPPHAGTTALDSAGPRRSSLEDGSSLSLYRGYSYRLARQRTRQSRPDGAHTNNGAPLRGRPGMPLAGTGQGMRSEISSASGSRLSSAQGSSGSNNCGSALSSLATSSTGASRGADLRQSALLAATASSMGVPPRTTADRNASSGTQGSLSNSSGSNEAGSSLSNGTALQSVHTFRSSELSGESDPWAGRGTFDMEEALPVMIGDENTGLGLRETPSGVVLLDCINVLELLLGISTIPSEEGQVNDPMHSLLQQANEIVHPEMLPVILSVSVIVREDSTRLQVLNTLAKLVELKWENSVHFLRLPLWQTMLLRLAVTVPFDSTLRSLAQEKVLQHLYTVLVHCVSVCIWDKHLAKGSSAVGEATAVAKPPVQVEQEPNPNNSLAHSVTDVSAVLGELFFQLAVNSGWAMEACMFSGELLTNACAHFRGLLSNECHSGELSSTTRRIVTSDNFWYSVGTFLRIIECFVVFRSSETPFNPQHPRSRSHSSIGSNSSSSMLGVKSNRDHDQSLKSIQENWVWKPLLPSCLPETVQHNIETYECFNDPTSCVLCISGGGAGNDQTLYAPLDTIAQAIGAQPENEPDLEGFTVDFGIHMVKGTCMHRTLLNGALSLWHSLEQLAALLRSSPYCTAGGKAQAWFNAYEAVPGRLNQMLETLDEIEKGEGARNPLQTVAEVVQDNIASGSYFQCAIRPFDLATIDRPENSWAKYALSRSIQFAIEPTGLPDLCCMVCQDGLKQSNHHVGTSLVLPLGPWLYGDQCQPGPCHAQCITCEECNVSLGAADTSYVLVKPASSVEDDASEEAKEEADNEETSSVDGSESAQGNASHLPAQSERVRLMFFCEKHWKPQHSGFKMGLGNCEG